MSATSTASLDGMSPLALPVILTVTLLITVNTAIVNVALPGIQQDLGFTPAALSWVINGYLLTYGGLLIAGGRLGDILGRRRTMLTGLGLFTAASALASISWSPEMLVAARVLQGIGGALASPSVLAIITNVFQGEDRTKALGWFSVVTGAGMSIGMIAGGAIMQYLSWRWIFLLNIPAGLALMALGSTAVPAMRSVSRHKLDLLGALLTTLTTVSLVFTFVRFAASKALDGSVVASLMVAIAALVCLIWRLRTASEPLIPLALFERRTVVGAMAANALLGGAMTGVVFFLSQLFGIQLALAPLAVGALFLVFTAPQLVSALTARKLIGRLGIRPFMSVSLLVSIAGMLLLGLSASIASLSLWLFLGMVLTGTGIGGVFLGINLTVMSAIDHRIAGAASGVLQMSLQLGASVGIAMLVLAQALLGTSGAFFTAAGFVVLAMLALAIRDRAATARRQ